MKTGFKHILALLFALLITATVSAQNAVDKMMEAYSTVGWSSYTMAVQRNPKTKKVEKVVKRLQISAAKGHTFIQTFRDEAAKSTNSSINKQHGEETTIFTEETAKASRIYMMKRPDSRALTSATITVIIQMK